MEDSKILTKPEEFKFLAKIFKEQNNETKKKFKPNLLFRATRDGDNGLIFHKKCDNIKDTLTLVKTKTGNIFGGYTSETWNGNNYKKDDNYRQIIWKKFIYFSTFNFTSSIFVIVFFIILNSKSPIVTISLSFGKL